MPPLSPPATLPSENREAENYDPEAKLELFMAARLSPNVDDLGDVLATPTHGAPSSGVLGVTRTNSILHARRMATRIGLGPYGQRELEKFITEPNTEQNLLIFAGILQLDQKISAIAVATGKYTVSTALLENIQKCSFAVLMSPKLSYYKKSTIAVKRVLAVLTHLNIDLPSDFGTNYYVFKEVKKVVNTQLTQQRSFIKKALKVSRVKNQSIYQMAVEVTNETKCIVTVPLCARLALLRAVHCEPGRDNVKFWDHVDTRLDLIRSKAGRDDDKIQAAVAGYLQKDRAKFGKVSEQMASSSVTNEWQTAIDDALVTAAPVEAPGGLDQEDDDEENEEDGEARSVGSA